MWQHTPSMLLLAIIIYMLLRAEERPVLAAWAGLPVALSYTCRPTDSLFVIVFTAYVAVRHRRYLFRYLLAAAPVAAAFLAYNLSVYHWILSPYYQSSLVGFYPRYWPKLAVGLAGQLDQPIARLIRLHADFSFRSVEHDSPEMEDSTFALAGRAGFDALVGGLGLYLELVGRDVLRSSLLIRFDAGLCTVSDSLFPGLDGVRACRARRFS